MINEEFWVQLVKVYGPLGLGWIVAIWSLRRNATQADAYQEFLQTTLQETTRTIAALDAWLRGALKSRD